MVTGGRWRSQKGRIVVVIRASRLGSDWCFLVTGGRPHVGAVGWAGGGVSPSGYDFPEHRDRAVVDLVLEALAPLPGRHIVVAGVHLDAITRAEIHDVLDLCRVLAGRVAAALVRNSA